MISFEEIKKYLPQYLTGTSQSNLFDELKRFPKNIDQRLYSESLLKDNIIYQGDGIKGLMCVNLPKYEIKPLPSMVLSNTCDIDPSNKRLIPQRIVYAPIFNLEKYCAMLISEKVQAKTIDDHILAIKNQFVSNIFFLPKGSNLKDDSIVFLDRLNNCSIEMQDLSNIREQRLFVLSNYGFYIFLIKLSIHFTRIRECVDRIVD